MREVQSEAEAAHPAQLELFREPACECDPAEGQGNAHGNQKNGDVVHIRPSEKIGNCDNSAESTLLRNCCQKAYGPFQLLSLQPLCDREADAADTNLGNTPQQAQADSILEGKSDATPFIHLGKPAQDKNREQRRYHGLERVIEFADQGVQQRHGQNHGG